ncbi:helix-turn-helix transcriptional regulator [Paenibacillus sacheonensis]|uniref:Helix-turn-helix domain-containing protein n=1 Tax=Paenibacillus sacheonensis TaxID=742054 RepID=A0A7X4YNB0_9BACL|nr:helix-turn-helix domain-containing protein [Paenibacillus sacheonensis]MBM7565560.1 AraC-like DNA-binding protein [Paenibacillus sacheonensis]NBC69521.1 helix-turn-helix domain-containing protein [Paenibacillus sacheonensis]
MPSYSAPRPCALRDLSPVVHWAQHHVRTPAYQWNRRIYDFELLFVKHGEIRATIGGEPYLARSGALIVLPPWEPHVVEVRSEPHAELIGVHFDFFDGAPASHNIIVDEQQINPLAFSAVPYLQEKPLLPDYLYPGISGRIVSLLEGIVQEWNERRPGHDAACKAMLLHLFTLLVRHGNEAGRQPLPKYEQRLHALAEEIRMHCSRNWTCAEMAKYVLVHEDYMSRQFKALMGVGPNKFVQSIRHQEAKRLLRETDHTIEWIAGAVGYEDFHYFSRIFKRWEGMSALQFRKLARMI